MKNQLLGLFFTIVVLQPAFAQPKLSPAKEREPKFIVGADIGFQWFNVSSRYSSLKIEYAKSPYRHFCLHYSAILSASEDYDAFDFGYSQLIDKGSFEIGLVSKYFPHGRFTGRKTGFYVAPDIRFGRRKYVSSWYDFQTGETIEVPFTHITSKLMFAWGVQWRFGKHVMLDLGAPIGIEYYQTKDPRFADNGRTFSNRNLVMMPAIMMGYAF